MSEPREKQAITYDEQQMGVEAVAAAGKLQVIAAVMFPLIVIATGALFGHAASDDSAPGMFAFGCVLGVVPALAVFLPVRVYVLDLRRRHLYMDRT